MANGDALMFLDKAFRPILTAVNKGNGAYVCSAKDLWKAFSDQSQDRTRVNWISPSVTIYHPVTGMYADAMDVSNTG